MEDATEHLLHRKIKWTDYTAIGGGIGAVFLCGQIYSVMAFNLGGDKRAFEVRVSQVEQSVIDAKSQLRNVDAAMNEVRFLRDELSRFREQMAEYNKRMDQLWNEIRPPVRSK